MVAIASSGAQTGICHGFILVVLLMATTTLCHAQKPQRFPLPAGDNAQPTVTAQEKISKSSALPPKRPLPEHQARLQEAKRLDERASQLLDAGESKEALTIAQDALQIRREVLGEESLDYVRSLERVARIHRKLKQYEKAWARYDAAYDLAKRVLGDEHSDCASIRDQQTALARDTRVAASRSHFEAIRRLATGKPLDAIPYAEKALRLSRLINRLNDRQVAQEYFNSLLLAAQLYESLAEYGMAESFYLEYFEALHSSYGDGEDLFDAGGPRVAACASCLARLYVRMGDYARAEPLYLRAIALLREEHGEDQEVYAASLSNLALLYHKIGAYAKAENL